MLIMKIYGHGQRLPIISKRIKWKLKITNAVDEAEYIDDDEKNDHHSMWIPNHIAITSQIVFTLLFDANNTFSDFEHETCTDECRPNRMRKSTTQSKKKNWLIVIFF